jgi:hypothetical protein
MAILDVSYRKTNSAMELGSVSLTDRDLKSVDDFSKAFQDVAKKLDKGTYTVYDGKNIFARFDVKDKQLIQVHKWSANTGIIFPCWKLFGE